MGFPRPSRGWCTLPAFLALITASPGQAHFVLESPASWWSQDAYGDPEKAPPCGHDGTGKASGLSTPFAPGDLVTISISEPIFHPGHYRVSLATGLGPDGGLNFPDEPAVTPGSTPCGSVLIDAHPAFPVLADGQLVHTAALVGTKSFQVKLPTDVTCAKCTLQVIEFMGEHPLNVPGGCFYHHCAELSILPADAGVDAGLDAGGGAGGGGGSVSTGGGTTLADAGSLGSGGGSAAGSGCTSLGAAPSSCLALAAWLLLRGGGGRSSPKKPGATG